MALDITATFPGKSTAHTAEYPQGGAQDITSPGDGTGTPWKAAIVNDWFGFFQSLLDEASIVPSNSPDEVGTSDYMDSLKLIIPQQFPGFLDQGTSTQFTITDTQSIFEKDLRVKTGLLKLHQATSTDPIVGSTDAVPIEMAESVMFDVAPLTLHHDFITSGDSVSAGEPTAYGWYMGGLNGSAAQTDGHRMILRYREFTSSTWIYGITFYKGGMTVPEEITWGITGRQKVEDADAVANGGTLSMSFGTSRNFQGTLIITVQSSANSNASTVTKYTVLGRNTNGSFTVDGTRNGISGGRAFGIAISASGIVTITNNAGSDSDINMTFYGSVKG